MIYEFRCHRCGRRFEVYATLKEKEAGLSPHCPRCGSADVARVFTPVLFLRRETGEGAAKADTEDLGSGPPGEEDAWDGDFGDDGNGFDGDEAGWEGAGEPDEQTALEEDGFEADGDMEAFGEAEDATDDDTQELDAERG